MQLLVARAPSTKRELLDAIAAESRVRVAVDEPRDRAEPPAVDLDDLARDGGQVAHAPHRLDRVAVAEHVRVLDDVDRAEIAPAQRRVRARRRRKLREVADEQHYGACGIRRPPRSAASIASG